MNAENVTYFDSLGVENIPKEIRKFIGYKKIIANIYRIQAYNSIRFQYSCIGFIDFMLKGKKTSSIQIYFILTNIQRMTK